MNEFYLRRRGLIATTACVLFAAAAPVCASATEAAIVPVQELVTGLLQVMKAGPGTPFQQRFNVLAPIIDRTFDLTAILQNSVGLPWEALPPKQQTMLMDGFRRYTVASYIHSFDEFDGQRFEVGPETRAVGKEQVVQTRLIPKKGDSHELDYVLRQGVSGWRIVDVLADGSISRVAVQRSDFRRLLTRGGAQALADSLLAKSADLSDGLS